MSHPDGQLKISISRADGEEGLVLTISSEFHCNHLRISLDQARALSLELIKQTYAAELHGRLGKAESRQSLPFYFRQPWQG